MKFKYILGIALLCLFELNSQILSKTNGVYGTDERQMLTDVTDDVNYSASEYKQLARSICLIVHKSRVKEIWATGNPPVLYPAGGINLYLEGTLEASIYHAKGGAVCSSVKFKDKMVSKGPCGTGVLIGERSILTTNHLFYKDGVEQNPSDYVCIFNWMDNLPKFWSTDSNCYYVNIDAYNFFRLVGYDMYYDRVLNKIGGCDLAIAKTDRITYINTVAIGVNTKSDLKSQINGKELFMIGHQLGLQLVISKNAKINPNISYTQAKKLIPSMAPVFPGQIVTQSQYDRLLFANLDGFEGNSGSPVFVKDENNRFMVIGIYQGGGDDFTKTAQNCYAENQIPEAEFNNGTSSEFFWTLKDLQWNRTCGSDCPVIQIQENLNGGTIVSNPISRGQSICVTVPPCCDHYGHNFEGPYVISFTDPVTKYIFWPFFPYNVAQNSIPFNFPQGGGVICSNIIPNGTPYRVRMYSLRTGYMEHDFFLSGTIGGGTRLATHGAVENNLADEGANTSEFCFVPNNRSGSIPLQVTFIPNVPNNQAISSWSWDFGDGNTSTDMYPTNIYTKPGVFSVSVTAMPVGLQSPLSKTYTDCITTSNIVSSIQNIQNINSLNDLNIIIPNTAVQSDITTCTAKNNIHIYPETHINIGTELHLKIQ